MDQLNIRKRTIMFAASLFIASLAPAQVIQQPSAKPSVDPAREDDATKALRLQAIDLYRSGKFVDAMPLLEKLASVNPQDFVVKEHWAFCVLQYSATLKDAEARKKARLQARTLGLEAQRMGDQGEMLQILLSIPEDGSDPKFSERKDVDEAMKLAEASFAKGDLDKAREGYLHVLELDPKNYEAAVFVGDVYFKEHAYNSAGEWFARAIQINPDRETAYRYWGDALAAGGKNDQAREKFINAVIAEPYNRPPWSALRKWADRINQPFNAIILENKSSAKTDGGKTTVTIDEHALQQDSAETAGWIAYSGARAAWQQEKFKKEFPSEPTYRHSLKEEAEALDTMVKVLAPDVGSQKKAEKLDPALLALIQIDREGLLEPFVLLNRADRQIALDYPAYRTAHRDKLYRYVDEFVLPKSAAQAAK
jgi:tetratricopeptide (TPR) repeat protein